METPVIISGRSNPQLAAGIAEYLGLAVGETKIETFPDGEISVEVLDNVRDRDLFVIQPVVRHPQLFLVELLLIIDALKRASARTIVPVIPYFGYARQDRRAGKRVPITAKLVADLLEKAGANHVLTMDLHAGQIEGFFGIPVDNLSACPALLQSIGRLGENWVVGCPDVGSMKIARGYAESLGLEIVVVDKRRIGAEEVTASTLIGSVQGKNVLLVDDICSTGNTLTQAAKLCKERGASRVLAAVTHGLFSGESPVEKMWVSDTTPQEGRGGVEVVSVAPLFGEAIKRMMRSESVSQLSRSV